MLFVVILIVLIRRLALAEDGYYAKDFPEHGRRERVTIRSHCCTVGDFDFAIIRTQLFKIDSYSFVSRFYSPIRVVSNVVG